MSSETPVQFKLPAPERTPRRAQRPSACMGMGMGMGGGMGMGMGMGMSMGMGMGMGMCKPCPKYFPRGAAWRRAPI